MDLNALVAVLLSLFSLSSPKPLLSPISSLPSSLPSLSSAVTLITTGDVIPARSVNWTMTRYNDFTYPFQKTAEVLRSADITLINLESPLIPDCPVTNKGMVFCGNQRFSEGLVFAGIDVANLANNHSTNFGNEGLCQTAELLTSNNILVTGLPPNLTCNQKPYNNLPAEALPSRQAGLAKTGLTIKTIENIKLGFLGFNILDHPDTADFPNIYNAIRVAKAQVDFLVVSFHWGIEYQPRPDANTVAIAHQAIEAGADLIAGNHPHWYQPLEIYKDKLIIYAHGNFIFDQEWSQETKTGFIAKHTISNGKLIHTEILPILIENYSQPYFLEGEARQKVLKDLIHR